MRYLFITSRHFLKHIVPQPLRKFVTEPTYKLDDRSHNFFALKLLIGTSYNTKIGLQTSLVMAIHITYKLPQQSMQSSLLFTKVDAISLNQHFATLSQSYIYQVLQTIQMKLILLCVWAEPAVLYVMRRLLFRQNLGGCVRPSPILLPPRFHQTLVNRPRSLISPQSRQLIDKVGIAYLVINFFSMYVHRSLKAINRET